MLSQMQLKLLKAFVHGDAYDALVVLKDDIVNDLKIQSSIGDTEFQTVKMTVEKETRIRALEDFFEELLKM